MRTGNPEGCQKVAGGRSEATTSGNGLMGSHPEGVQDVTGLAKEELAPLQGADD